MVGAVFVLSKSYMPLAIIEGMAWPTRTCLALASDLFRRATRLEASGCIETVPAITMAAYVVFWVVKESGNAKKLTNRVDVLRHHGSP